MQHVMKTKTLQLASEIWGLLLAVSELLRVIVSMCVALYALTHGHFYEGMILIAVMSLEFSRSTRTK